MTPDRLKAILSGFRKLKIAVLGDLFLDQWYTMDPALDEPSLETGLTAYQTVSRKSLAGAAGTVISNLAALGVGEIRAISFIGRDGAGWEVLRRLEELHVNAESVFIDDGVMTPTYMKPMFIRPEGLIEGNRWDVKNHARTPEALQRRLAESLREIAGGVDAVIALDQLTETDTGVITEYMRGELERLGKDFPKLIIFADSRAHISKFRGVSIKCNDIEAARALGIRRLDTDNLARAVESLTRVTGKPAYITLGKRGIAVEGGYVVPAARQTGFLDICGAGDSVTAGMTAALCLGASAREAALIGNLAAGVTVRKPGTGTASPEEVLELFEREYANG